MAVAKKRYKSRKPTVKQQRAIANVVGNGGNVTKAMRDAGYSENTLQTPQKLTESSAWRDVFDEHLPDKALAEVHQRLLKKEDVVIRTNADGEMEVISTGQMDVQAVSKALDMAYKLKGSYAPEKSLVASVNLNEEKQQQSNDLIDRILGNKKDS